MRAAAEALQELNATRQERLETVGTALWLVMDFTWLLDWAWLGIAAGAFGVSAFALVFRYIQRDLASFAANGSAACWLLMNFSWMVQESFAITQALVIAKSLGGLALTLLLVSVWSGGLSGPVMQQFRRIKVWHQPGRPDGDD